MKQKMKEKIENVKLDMFWFINSSKNICTVMHKRRKEIDIYVIRKIKQI